MRRSPRLGLRALAVGVVATALVGSSALAANAYPSDDNKPDLLSILGGFSDYWTPEPGNPLHGTIENADVLARNDELVSWINTNATADTRFAALQDSLYGAPPSSYDQSITAATAMGSILGPIYVRGRQTGALPLTSAVVSTQSGPNGGSSGSYISTSQIKGTFSYPRPYLPTNVNTDQTGWVDGCRAAEPTNINGSSLAPIRDGRPYTVTDSDIGYGNLLIDLIAPQTDDTGRFTTGAPRIDPEYGDQPTNGTGICTGGSYPSGHTRAAFSADLTLGLFLPEIAPELAARASEGGLHRVVVAAHYPLDVIGGRLVGEAAIAARWSDAEYRTAVLEPARAELRGYLEAQCGDTIANCYAKGQPYTSDPFGGLAMPGGTAQIVTDRASAVNVYTERLTYGFATSGQTGLPASVPTGAENLLLTVFPTLSAAQRTSVLAQTEIASGYPLDESDTAAGSWQRLNLAAAMSATVKKNLDGTVTVLSTGGTATVQELPSADIVGPPTIAPGDKGTFTFAGFDPNEAVSFSLTGENASGATLATIRAAVETATLTRTADASGVARITVTLPSNARGTYTLTGTGQTSGVTGSFTFSVGLPATGTDAGSTTGLWVGGGLLALGGAVALAFASRRRTGHTARG
jgi:LPXTG-motif cell wall-anchored protein